MQEVRDLPEICCLRTGAHMNVIRTTYMVVTTSLTSTFFLDHVLCLGSSTRTYRYSNVGLLYLCTAHTHPGAELHGPAAHYSEEDKEQTSLHFAQAAGRCHSPCPSWTGAMRNSLAAPELTPAYKGEYLLHQAQQCRHGPIRVDMHTCLSEKMIMRV